MNAGIDIARHCLALAVIVQHMASSSRYSAETLDDLRELTAWIDGSVAGFFVISGFLFSRPPILRDYVQKQVVRLLVPFVLFSVAYAAVLAAAGKVPLVHGLYETMMLRGTGMQLYFLPFLLLVTIGFAAAESRMPARWRTVLLLGCTALLLTLCLAMPTTGVTGPDLRLLPYYSGAFLLGALYRDFRDSRITEEPQNRKRLALLGALALLAGAGALDSRIAGLAGILAFVAAAIVVGSRLQARRYPGSGGVYLLHTPVVNFAISTVLDRAGLHETANWMVSVILTYATCLAATLLFIRLIPRRRWLLLE